MEIHRKIKEICDLIDFNRYEYNKGKEVFIQKEYTLDWDIVEIIMDYKLIIIDRMFISNLSVFFFRKFNFILSKEDIKLILSKNIIELEYTAVDIIYDLIKKLK